MISEKPTNPGSNNDLLTKARKLNTYLPAHSEEVPAGQLKQKQQELWQKRNSNATKVYDRFVQAHGVFSDRLRSF